MTPSEKFQDRDDRQLSSERQADNDARVREWNAMDAAVELYPHLAGIADACREAKLFVLRDKLDWLENERAMLQEQIDEE